MNQKHRDSKDPASFRDPSGFVFTNHGAVYRQVNNVYKKEYDTLMKSGLYHTLADSGLLVKHQEVDIKQAQSRDAYKVLKPDHLSFISYPYEWSFSQLKDAALATLAIQKKALEHNMMLRDCSAYNIQFVKGKPLFIDTLSFEPFDENKSWVGPYQQFCRHFLAPLTLMSYVDINLSQLMRLYIDGIPLDVVSKVLPKRTYFNKLLVYHIHTNARVQQQNIEKNKNPKQQKMSKQQLLALVNTIEQGLSKLSWNPADTIWGDYYEETLNYSSGAFENKKKIISDFIDLVKSKIVLDLGGNTGIFSRIASDKGIETISTDIDPAAIEKNYLEVKKRKEQHILPLLLDLTNPSPDIGWENTERASFFNRNKADTIMALALIHHLAIANNLPLDRCARFFSDHCKNLIIEFVPKEDSNAQRLLEHREDIFPLYNKQDFEKIFKTYFKIIESAHVKDSKRTLYLMRKR